MLTNKQIKLINSLHSKKGRKESDLFLVEGEKGIQELFSSHYVIKLLVLNETQTNFLDQIKDVEIVFVSEEELIKLSSLTTNTFGFAVVQAVFYELPIFRFDDQMTLVLDGVRDPGNLGTIIRICDWYGVKQVILSSDSTEFYNPKVISASMGSFSRIKFLYTELDEFLKKQAHLPVIAAKLDGVSIYSYTFPSAGFLVMGNESVGIRPNLLPYFTDSISIPRIGMAESLNVAISTGIILDNFRRN
jgi:TrmH family RNA methyltransferase